jgi:hypothetical protein
LTVEGRRTKQPHPRFAGQFTKRAESVSMEEVSGHVAPAPEWRGRRARRVGD